MPNLGGGDGDSPVRSPPSAGTQRTGMRRGTLPGHTLQATRGGCPLHPVSNGGWKLVSLGKGEFLYFYIMGTLQVNARR